MHRPVKLAAITAAVVFVLVLGVVLVSDLTSPTGSSPIGTTLFIVIREVVSTHWEHHSLIVGVMAILVVILAPKGLVGLWRAALSRFERDEPAAPPPQALRAEP